MLYRPTKLIFPILLISLLIVIVIELKSVYDKINQYNVLTDFVQYWAAGRLILLNDNPYSAEQVSIVQKSVGWTKPEPLVTFNPPWVFPFILPFCLNNYALSKFLWLLFNMVILFICGDWIWRFYGGEVHHRYYASLITFTFAPAWIALGMGQISLFMLLGVLAFMHYVKLRKWWGAGLVLILIAIKPHTLYLFWIALLLWVCDEKKWKLVYGIGSSGIAAIAVPMFFYPDILHKYISFVMNQPPMYHFISPVPGSFLRLLSGENRLWLQFLPSFIGILWLLFYWRKRRKSWRWDQQIPAITFVSLLTAPYGWSWDYSLLLPVIIKTGIGAFRVRQKVNLFVPTFIYLLLNSIALYLRFAGIPDHFMFWYLPALLLNYIIWLRTICKNSSQMEL